MTSEKFTYYQFPLCLMQETYKNTVEGLNLISSFGIVNYALKFTVNMEDVEKQLMYAYYRDQDKIQNHLLRKLRQYIDAGAIDIDEDYNGFQGAEFSPEQEIEGLKIIFKNDPQFKDAAILRWQVYKAAESLKIDIGSLETTLNRYNKGLLLKSEFERRNGPDVWPSVKPSQLFEFRDSGKDIDLFRAYIGIKSIIGQREFHITHKSVIICRMFGCKSDKALKEFLKENKEARELYNKFSKRYWTDRLLTELETRGFITKISYPKWGVFVSASIQDKETLAKKIIAKKNQRSLAKQELAARKMLQQHIHNTTE